MESIETCYCSSFVFVVCLCITFSLVTFQFVLNTDYMKMAKPDILSKQVMVFWLHSLFRRWQKCLKSRQAIKVIGEIIDGAVGMGMV